MLFPCQYGIRLLQDLIIPEPQYCISFCLYVPCSFFIMINLDCMLTTIELDNEHFIKTDKVNDIWSYRMLAPEFESFQLAVS